MSICGPGIVAVSQESQTYFLELISVFDCNSGLQLGIRGASVVVVSCAPNGPADRCKQILKFDTVLEVDGKAPGSTIEEVCNTKEVQRTLKICGG